MRIENFDYFLPKDLIAQKPIRPRDHSRLLVLDRKTQKIKHNFFYSLPNYLQKGDLLVFNNSKVFPARLWSKKQPAGGKIEVLLLKKISQKIWEILLGGKSRKVGLEIIFSPRLNARVTKQKQDGIWEIKFNLGGKKFDQEIKKIGQVPTPPYIKQKSNLKDYQTIYATKIGSVAAPTAGFHFTKNLINKLKKKGVQFEYVTLHVGFGTFQPVKIEDIEKHDMHPEFVEIKKEVIQRLWKAKKEGRRTIAVGTTSVRALETVMGRARSPDRALKGWINLFIYPGYKFKFVDALITNFHLPKSTLLMLVAAFLQSRGMKASATHGINSLKRIYRLAIRKKYRFYSFGDAMLII